MAGTVGAYGLQTVYNLELQIGISQQDSTWTYAPLAAGLDNLTEALNEIVQQYFFMSDKGFARNHVTGMAPAYTLTGRRIHGDSAQDFIFGEKFSLDTSRQSSLQLSDPATNMTLTCDCTFCNIQEYGGASTDDNAISFELRLDGKPTLAETPGA